jgi:5-methylcytosine-specific restriction endonuclease McrA
VFLLIEVRLAGQLTSWANLKVYHLRVAAAMDHFHSASHATVENELVLLTTKCHILQFNKKFGRRALPRSKIKSATTRIGRSGRDLK